MKSFVSLSFIALLLAACSSSEKKETDIGQVQNDVMQSDLAFSKMSEDSGYIKAFIAFADEKMIKLNPKNYATFGRQQLIEESNKNPDGAKSITLTWKPLHVIVASSGDLASAFGDYQMKAKLPSNKDTLIYGNYITVWRKQPDGAWKFVLDGGNPTPGPTDVSLLDKLK